MSYEPQTKQSKENKKTIYIFCCKTKGICEYKQGQRKPKWKAPRGFTSNSQAQAIRKGKRVGRGIEGQEEPLERQNLKSLAMLLMMKHAMSQERAPHLG